jgi:hypothetical protein
MDVHPRRTTKERWRLPGGKQLPPRRHRQGSGMLFGTSNRRHSDDVQRANRLLTLHPVTGVFVPKRDHHGRHVWCHRHRGRLVRRDEQDSSLLPDQREQRRLRCGRDNSGGSVSAATGAVSYKGTDPEVDVILPANFMYLEHRRPVARASDHRSKTSRWSSKRETHARSLNGKWQHFR